ncbi:glycoside hydrolase family 71/99-like protein [Pelagicoccus sp. SDUM812003]|uniref:glycoside hydrolase family 71/99-like protein n=1 Tax=Pelagicoccus sp. SDUM812003 TaxID=3041267 RepID=UPI00280F4D0A|nr:glycoside hydrolase family 71/99-like protein [Pelagicoccus sp. SDUM812003]MDQ8204151.1 glycoside hydrolase family 71/99-like protein [Pelagicoccus sp. SDUM812003]
MPWYQSEPVSGYWGWHWTMNSQNPDRLEDGRYELASHFRPLIGPYDSSDEHVLEYHLLLMKLAGVDGVIIDWYGLSDFRDYPQLHRASVELVRQVERLGMTFAICYEDQTISALVDEDLLDETERVSHAVSEIEWLARNWFSKESYLDLDGAPVLLSFGLDGLSDSEWSSSLQKLAMPVAYFSEHHKRTAAIGAFDWPIPSEGIAYVERFQAESQQWPHSIPAAFPRFVDFYEQAGVGRSWGSIPDDNGRTFRQTLDLALDSQAPIIQLVTWNDWGEGTAIEPSVEFGYRDLEYLQKRLKGQDAGAALIRSADLRLPYKLLQLRREGANTDRLEEASIALARGDLRRAREVLDREALSQK